MNFENLKKELARRLIYQQAAKKAWANVEFLTKKDGSPFANLRQNFNNLSVTDEPYSLRKNEKKLTVYFDANGWRYESISNTICVKYSQFKPEENRIIKERGLEPYFFLSIEEIKILINERIKYHDAQIVKISAELKNIDKKYKKFNKVLQPALDWLKENDYSHLWKELAKNYVQFSN